MARMALFDTMRRIPQSAWVGFAAVLLLLWGIQPFSSAPINPEVLHTFDAIVARCEAEAFPDATLQCRNVLALRDACVENAAKHRCRVDNLHASLERLGYLLPPLYGREGQAVASD